MPPASQSTTREGNVNKLQKGLRAISDERMDDTAVEIDACEQARLALDITRRALLDGQITVGEAREIVAAQQAVVDASDRSLEYNIRQQPELDAFIAHLANVPADAIARLPRVAFDGREAA